MRGGLVSALAGSLLLGHSATDHVAPPASTAEVAGCQSLGSTACADFMPKLARFADAAYGDASTTTVPPAGFHPADLAGLDLRAGRYTNGSGTALVMDAQLDQRPVLVVGFGGSSDPATWLADLRDINAPYRQFLPLIRAVEVYAAAGGKVVLVGHSFGGAMVQLFMFAHARDDSYRAVTFGSPGALPEPGAFAAKADPRIANFVIADDPYVFLGEHRADVADYARRHRMYAFALAAGIARESGLSLPQVVASEPYLTANYVNNGSKIILPSRRPALSVPTVVGADSDEHDIEAYETHFGSGNG
jgi:hypothetical protein